MKLNFPHFFWQIIFSSISTKPTYDRACAERRCQLSTVKNENKTYEDLRKVADSWPFSDTIWFWFRIQLGTALERVLKSSLIFLVKLKCIMAKQSKAAVFSRIFFLWNWSRILVKSRSKMWFCNNDFISFYDGFKIS